jgi:lysophospholipid acyltransferase (LPLAT)-like uncharacterized protein
LKLDKAGLILKASQLLLKSVKVERVFLSQPTFPSIVTFWHGRMFLLPFALKEYADRVAILISRHRDGELASELVSKLGFKVVRGSAGRGKGGTRAFLEMVKLIKEGFTVAITPDGPKGPKEVVKPGVARLSMVTGAPVYPLTFSCKRCFTLNSWDRFKIPKPFTSCRVLLGNPIKPSDFKGVEELRKGIELKLKELTEEAESKWARP